MCRSFRSNLTQGDGETIDYNAFNKPVRIDAIGSNAFADFSYGADLRRYRQMRSDGTRIYYLDKLMEIEAVGNSSGSMVEFRAYDPYGRPRNGNWTDKAPEPILASSVTDRGFTDHEHLDDWQLIHMNGRGFDYNSGRFLSLDPFIQEPGNSQSINGFAYIMNNPLSGTDPSGYFSMMVKVSYRNKSTSAYFGGTPVRHSNQRENNQVNNGATNDQQAQHVDLRGKVSRDLH